MMDIPVPNSSSSPICAGRKLAVFSDFDGTLIEFRPIGMVALAPVNQELQDLLTLLLRAMEGAVAVVSGRETSSLVRLLPPERIPLPISGSHGAEWRLSLNQAIQCIPRAVALDEVHLRLRQRLEHVENVFLENKDFSVAVHDLKAPLNQPMLNSLCSIAQDLPEVATLDAQGVIEFRMRGVTKGTAVQEMMRHAPFTDRRPIFLGDDTTDLDGFAACRAMGGLAVSVGAKLKGRGDLDLAGPGEVRTWLRLLAIDPAQALAMSSIEA